MIVFDPPALLGVILRQNAVAERAFWAAMVLHTLAISADVEDDLLALVNRPLIARYIEPGVRAEVISLLFEQACWVEPQYTVIEAHAPADNRVLELAEAADADIIIAASPSLLALHYWRGIRILSAAAYLALPRVDGPHLMHRAG